MVEAILLQILPPVREALWVHTAYHCNCVIYVEHVLLHSLVLPLLDFIQSPYHGIIVALVTECLLHVHQQVPHGDILALVQHVGPFAGVPTETGEDVGAHTGFIILLEEGVHIKVPERVHHLGPWIGRLKRSAYPISQVPAVSSPYSLCSPCAYASGPQSHLQWSTCQSPVPLCLGRREASPCMGGEPSLSHLFHPRGSSGLLWCTSHQLAQGVRPPCNYNWNIRDWILCLTSQPLVVRGSN